MEKDLITIIMSAYNEKEEWFEKSLYSILNQTYKNIEVILIIDNPNNEGIINLAKKINDNRLKLIINKENRGLVYCLNKGLEISNGSFIARMDADDISMPSRLEKQINYMHKNSEVILLGTQPILIDEYDNLINRKEILPTKFKDIKRALKYTNVFYHPSIMFRKDFIMNIGGYRDIKYAEDYDLITRIVINKGKVENLNEKLLKYRIRESGITQSNSDIQKNSEKFIKRNFRNGKLNNCAEFCDNSKFAIKDKLLRKVDRFIYKVNSKSWSDA